MKYLLIETMHNYGAQHYDNSVLVYWNMYSEYYNVWSQRIQYCELLIT